MKDTKNVAGLNMYVRAKRFTYSVTVVKMNVTGLNMYVTAKCFTYSVTVVNMNVTGLNMSVRASETFYIVCDSGKSIQLKIKR